MSLFNMNLFRVLILIVLLPYYLSGQDNYKNIENSEIGIIEQLDSYLPGDITLISETGDTIQTKDLLGLPTVLSLVYFRCPGICTPLMDGLASVIKKTDLMIGEDYQVVTVSFNPREGSELALRKKSNYVNLLGLEEVKEGWTFYTSDSSNISQLTESVGFRYKQSGNDYLHVGTLIFIAPDGKITRYLNGTRFLPFEFKMAVLETTKGQSGPTINKVLQYCYAYDPKGQSYVLNITRVAGVFITLILFTIFISLVIRSFIIKSRTKKNALPNE
jgi:protein SCO1